MKSSSLLVFLFLIGACKCWDNDDYEIFDLITEVKNVNFYEMLNVTQDATQQQIKKAFRALSIVLHPDKNDAEDANIVFRNLVSVYDVLKDASKREKYNLVLKNGLPSWRSGAYYYRYVRKMGLTEMFIILFVLITIGQYLVGWAVYVERKFTAREVFGSKIKKLQKKHKNVVDIETILNEIPTPSVKNTLPFQIPMFVFWIFTGAPRELKNTVQMYSEMKRQAEEEKQRAIDEAEEQRKNDEKWLKEREEAKQLRKRNKKVVAPEKTDKELAAYTQSILKATASSGEVKKTRISGLWTDDDLAELVRLVKKYPGGTANRWEVIADYMNRNVNEVTVMAAKMKDLAFKVPGQTESVAETILQEAKKKEKTKKSDSILIAETTWSQQQQQALENSIQKHPKGVAGDRWQKIANNVPGKTKEECMQRYKYLVELVKKQKSGAEPSKAEDERDEVMTMEAHDPEPEPVEEEEAPLVEKQTKERKNKRKERKKNIEYYEMDDEDDMSD